MTLLVEFFWNTLLEPPESPSYLIFLRLIKNMSKSAMIVRTAMPPTIKSTNTTFDREVSG